MLGEIRTEAMGLPPLPRADILVAEKIRDWYENPGYGTAYPRPAELT
jgi:hypothetical protein